MDGFNYTDIFETKGIEYIIIIAFLIILIPFWILLNKESLLIKRLQRALGVITSDLIRIPQGLYFNKNHTWIFLEKSGQAKVGIDDFLIKILGDVQINLLKTTGDKISKGEVLAVIVQAGKRLNIVSPISGEIIVPNNSFNGSQDILQDDPYDNGWIYSVKPSNWKGETQSFYIASEASEWIKNEFNRFKDFLAASTAKYSSEPSLISYQEGGELRAHVLSEFDNKTWEDFEESFLKD